MRATRYFSNWKDLKFIRIGISIRYKRAKRIHAMAEWLIKLLHPHTLKFKDLFQCFNIQEINRLTIFTDD